MVTLAYLNESKFCLELDALQLAPLRKEVPQIINLGGFRLKVDNKKRLVGLGSLSSFNFSLTHCSTALHKQCVATARCEE